MIPLRLVLDTNIVISASLNSEGLQRTVLLLAIKKPVSWYASDAILAEYSAVLARQELRIRRTLRHQFLELMKKHCRVVIPSNLPLATTDAHDNIFIECADAARADYLVTGNIRHFPKFWKKTKIINSRDFLDVIAPHLIG
jgi:putative PIN family toxin of toxin-antitoxin system